MSQLELFPKEWALENGLKFYRAGRANFTVKGKEKHYTFKIAKKKDADNVYFVSLLTGSHNENDYTYIGLWSGIGHLSITRNSKMRIDSPCILAFNWAMDVARYNWPSNGRIFHAGRCGRCGRLLTTPESIACGFGPECKDKV